MDLVIDAPLVKCFYQESERQSGQTECRCAAAPLFQRLGAGDIAVLDSKGQLEREWKSLVDQDWFKSWLSQCYQVGSIVEIDVDNEADLLRALASQCGFPHRSGDKWLVRVAVTRAKATGECVALVSEDVDFFDPKVKNDARARKNRLDRCSGPVARALKKSGVKCITADSYLADC